jgi:hypothetical protein
MGTRILVGTALTVSSGIQNLLMRHQEQAFVNNHNNHIFASLRDNQHISLVCAVDMRHQIQRSGQNAHRAAGCYRNLL